MYSIKQTELSKLSKVIFALNKGDTKPTVEEITTELENYFKQKQVKSKYSLTLVKYTNSVKKATAILYGTRLKDDDVKAALEELRKLPIFKNGNLSVITLKTETSKNEAHVTIKKTHTDLFIAEMQKKGITLDVVDDEQRGELGPYNKFVQEHSHDPSLADLEQSDRMKKLAEMWNASDEKKNSFVENEFGLFETVIKGMRYTMIKLLNTSKNETYYILGRTIVGVDSENAIDLIAPLTADEATALKSAKYKPITKALFKKLVAIEENKKEELENWEDYAV